FPTEEATANLSNQSGVRSLALEIDPQEIEIGIKQEAIAWQNRLAQSQKCGLLIRDKASGKEAKTNAITLNQAGPEWRERLTWRVVDGGVHRDNDLVEVGDPTPADQSGTTPAKGPINRPQPESPLAEGPFDGNAFAWHGRVCKNLSKDEYR